MQAKEALILKNQKEIKSAFQNSLQNYFQLNFPSDSAQMKEKSAESYTEEVETRLQRGLEQLSQFLKETE